MELVDAGSPEATVKRILQAESNLPVPVPIQELCARLGILRIEDLDTDDFKGGLVTDAKQSEGTILAKRKGGPRRRFTIKGAQYPAVMFPCTTGCWMTLAQSPQHGCHARQATGGADLTEEGRWYRGARR
ncbi:hypothetical protein [Methylobacterium sp. ARG-1]|uniref:hypothetical protein n=1 Tax=Methylobacterium sp. ARG-1 TaxID=1692501 RepID=UPI00068023E5|nr:hypothetical protein [Methylobacterium sp. ARG-1]KNY24289.1 hypothetical protein AKJ13_03305 [Methylobacterium sp. ARG-1]